MSGLLLKDIYTLFSKTKFFLLMIAFFAVLPGASVSAFAIFYSVMLPMTTLAYDEQTKWPQLAAMMPYSTKELVLSKYLLGWLAVLVTSLLAWFGNVLTAGSFAPAAIIGSLLDPDSIYYVFMMLCLALCFMMLNLPMTFFLGVEKGRLFNLLVLVLIFLLLSTCVSSEAGWFKWLMGEHNAYIALPAVAALALVGNLLSIMISIRLYQRKALQGGHV